MNKNKGIVGIGLILAIVLGIVVVGGGAYLLGKSGSKPVVINPENTLPNNQNQNQNQNLPVDNSKQVNITNPTVPPVTTGCTSSSVPSITVLSPNGGEVFKAGQKITVKWSSCNLSKDKLFYIGLTSELSGNKDTTTLSSQTENDGTEVLSLPQKNITSGNSYKVGISYYYQTDTSYFDNSDNYFTINSGTTGCTSSSVPSITVLSPNGGETFILGQTINIKWTSKCIDSKALVYLNIGIKDSQAVAELLSNMKVANTGSYNFIIPSNYNINGNGYNKYVLGLGYVYGNGEGVSDISDDSFTINYPGTTQIKVYFAKKSFSGCAIDIKASDLDYFYRSIPKTQAVARASIEELLKGPTQEEINLGYLSDIPNGTILKSITITNGVALVDFNSKIESGTTSCSGGMKLWQIRQTLLQFPTIKTVKFSVDGRTENIFQA